MGGYGKTRGYEVYSGIMGKGRGPCQTMEVMAVLWGHFLKINYR